MDGNPWQVDSLQDFLYLKCPECTFDTQEDLCFQDHAIENHPLSFVFFGETFVKEENFELNERYSEEYIDPLTINGGTQDKSDIMSSDNHALAPLFPKLSNIKEDLTDDKSDDEESVIEETNWNNLTKKYKQIEEFFILESSNTRENGIVDMEFSCVQCSPKRVVLKTNSMSNLIDYLKRRHPDAVEIFRDLLISHKRDKSENGKAILEEAKLNGLRMKYKHIEEFFIFKSAKTKENGTINMEFSCVSCSPAIKVLIANSLLNMSHLIKHLKILHPDVVDRFKALLSSNKRESGQKSEAEKIANKFNPETPKPHICPKCNRGYSTAEGLIRHKWSAHTRKKLMQKCEYCDYTSVKKWSIKKHERKTHPDLVHKPFKCIKCDYFCVQKKELTKHDREVHNAKKIQCPKCDKKIAPLNLRVHIKRMHDKIFPFLCNTCGYKATSNAELKNHVDVVHEGKRHICPICGKGSTTPTVLKYHIASVHEGNKPYKCELCDTSCSTQWKLNFHIRNVHEKIKLHKCNECQKFFGTKQILNNHVTAVHEGIKAFKCSLCDKTFFSESGLHSHNMRVHEGKKSHMCSQCGESFFEGATLRRHIKGVHDKETPHVCKICNHGFKQNGNLKYHMATVHKGIGSV